ncbi:MAG: glycosyltransferase family 2 protein [Sedimentisphaerales bacterium]|nr:glycosyltransferase family 2 protein [Sedimentisphaerales bacterium]
MDSTIKKAVVIPAYKVISTVTKVVNSIPEFIDFIIVVDDKCPEGSGKKAESLDNPRVTVIYHDKNKGVGAAVKSGYQKAMELGCEVVVKIDGDGQMDPEYMENLIKPLLLDQADYTKGNRFVDFKALRAMPKARLIGNNMLSFLEKIFSGYWDIMDPTNGYTAIHKRVLGKLDLNKIADRFFFESDMLFNLNLYHAVVLDIPIPAKYENEPSSLSIGKTLVKFPPRLLYGCAKRIFLKYFIYDFNMASVYILVGLPLFLWGLIFGIVEWADSIRTGVPRHTGAIMLCVLPLIVSIEILLQAINIDIRNVPRKGDINSKWNN